MKVNWKIRFKHKHFLLSFFSLVLLASEKIASFLFGIDTTIYNEALTEIFHSILTILILLGIVVDPTTNSMSDSNQAQNYKTPKKDEK